MRQSLMTTFDDIYTLDLHGNVKKKEQSPDGSLDKNVFDIQQGVSIGIFAKEPDIPKSAATINHAHLWGSREVKNSWLSENDLSSTQWSKLQPALPFSLFIPQDNTLLPEYDRYWKITDIMKVNSTGVKTHRDHFAIDFDMCELEERIINFRDLKITDQTIVNKYGLKDTRDWKMDLSRRSLAQNKKWEQHLTKCLYRPFDTRAYYHHKDVVELPRSEVMQHMLAGENLALICKRQSIDPARMNYFSCSNQIVADGYFAADNKGRDNIFPLYLYPTTQGEKEMGMTPDSNLSREFLSKLQQNLGYQPTPEAIFHYIYAIFHSPTYRSRYAEFLKIDFPRVPLTSDDKLFKQLATFGEKLVNLHLMKSTQTGRGGDWESGLGGNSSAEVGAGYPKYESGKVTINKQGEGFINVPEAVWKFHVGGYQVCHKWLKDRKGRILSAADIAHYQGIVAALGETQSR